MSKKRVSDLDDVSTGNRELNRELSTVDQSVESVESVEVVEVNEINPSALSDKADTVESSVGNGSSALSGGLSESGQSALGDVTEGVVVKKRVEYDDSVLYEVGDEVVVKDVRGVKWLRIMLSVLVLATLIVGVYELSLRGVFNKSESLTAEGVSGVYDAYIEDMNTDLLEGDNLAKLMDTYFSEQLRADMDLETSRESFEATIGAGLAFNGEITGTKIVEDPEGNVIRVEVSVREWIGERGVAVSDDVAGIGVYTFIEEEGRIVISDMVDYTNATEVDEDGKIKQ